ncbi:type 1 glutamine amidotransferase [Kineosporia sp. J2-2]|uniref:Type 1 glutamine amidotransferase n=1 Tax=Kineosporia corallincola TaxID=2835133 RepID=A0ABS5TLN9_9ACTN|nr:type 1 glutamine amidotransferase [Kineosporia corallincola]MBT0770968.1 type 1 glutamine amidotransferase [Kineosporia corallincola]
MRNQAYGGAAEVRPVLIVEHESACPPALFGAGLSSSTVDAETVRPYRGDPVPGDLDRYDGLVVLGGAMAAWDDEVAPWLPAVRALLAGAVARNVPTLGICLGAQLLALACGGRVERGAAGLEAGVNPVTVLPAADADPFFGPVGDRLGSGPWQVRHFHHDAVTALPPDAELLVTGKVYPHQGFRVGENAWAVQYHPEVSGDGFAVWAARAEASGAVPSAAALLAPVRAAEQTQARVAQAHAAAFVSALQPAFPG